MKLLILLPSLFLAFTISGQTLDSLQLDGTTLLYHKLETQTTPKKGMLIFMHGGVSQFKEPDKPIEISPKTVVEGNTDFLPFVQSLGYDVILPLAFKEYNWMEEPGQQFVLALAEKYSEQNEKVILSGFSDGGTGAYQIFYSHPDQFDVVMIFNGYPQHHNFYQKVDYTKVTDKPVLFASTKNDKRIPYEFLLTEYRRQKIVNPNAYFHLAEGGHSFADYKLSDLEKYFTVIEKPRKLAPASDLLTVYPPIDGWMENDTLKEIYPFRKSVVKKYGMAKAEYSRKDYDFKELSKLIEEGPVSIASAKISKNDLQRSQTLKFTLKVRSETLEIEIINWLTIDSWE